MELTTVASYKIEVNQLARSAPFSLEGRAGDEGV